MFEVPKLVVFGGGNMGGAVLRGAVRAGVLRPDEIGLVEPDAGKRAEAETLGLRVWSDPGCFAGRTIPAALLAVKPQVFPELAATLTRERCRVEVAISLMAGVTTGVIARLLAGGGPGPRVVRAMPNLPAMVGEGLTALAPGEGAKPADVALAEKLFGGVGVIVSARESQMDAFTALAGSGPAYVFYLAEVMMEAARAMGLDDAAADATVRQTLLGSATLLSQSLQAPEGLRAGVTSPGGTTAAAVKVLEDERVKAAWVRAILAAKARGEELGRQAGAG
jgi:pyrroline-5-carboxylate reductase